MKRPVACLGAVFLFLLSLSACSLMQSKPSDITTQVPPAHVVTQQRVSDSGETASDTLIWRTRMLQACPYAESEEKKKSVLESGGPLAVVGEILLGKTIDYAVNAFSQAVNAAAQRDRDGISFDSSRADFLFIGERREGVWSPAINRCVVVAYGKPGSANQIDWCNSSYATKESDDGAATIDDEREKNYALPCNSRSNRLRYSRLGGELGIEAPIFYAEIELLPAESLDAFRGSLNYLYYPEFLTKRSVSTRDLFITATLRKPAGDPSQGTTVASLAFALKGLKPGASWNHVKQMSQDVLGWSPLPVVPEASKLNLIAAAKYREDEEKYPGCAALPLTKPLPAAIGTATSASGNDHCTIQFEPISVSMTVRETGDVNKFLQYMATWFATPEAQKSLSDPLKDTLLPSRREAAETTQANQQAAAVALFNTAVVSYFTARSAYETACAAVSSPVTPEQRTGLNGKLFQWQLAYETLQKTAMDSGSAKPAEVTQPARCEQH